MNLILALLATIIIEMPVVILFFHKYEVKGLVVNIVLINSITNLTLNLMRTVGLVSNLSILLLTEVIIVITEAFMYCFCIKGKNVPVKRIFFASFLANAISFSLGMIFFGV